MCFKIGTKCFEKKKKPQRLFIVQKSFNRGKKLSVLDQNNPHKTVRLQYYVLEHFDRGFASAYNIFSLQDIEIQVLEYNSLRESKKKKRNHSPVQSLLCKQRVDTEFIGFFYTRASRKRVWRIESEV